MADDSQSEDVTARTHIRDESDFEGTHRKNAAAVISHLGRCFAAARERAGLSQEEVAHAAQITTRTYGTVERGWTPQGLRANPTIDTVLRIAAALNNVPGTDTAIWERCRTCPLASRA